jgi:pimeloyl-ACP methyl ester carboxylesterase
MVWAKGGDESIVVGALLEARQARQAQPRKVPANGLEHHVLEWDGSGGGGGGGARLTVVLVHGFLDAAATWDRVAPILAFGPAAGHRVIAPDMRGFGDGARVPPGGYYHFVDYVFDLADVTEALAPEPFALVGHSMGGTIATLFAGTFPERVVRLASLEGLGPPDTSFELGPVRMRRWIDEVRAVRARGDERPTYTRDEALRRLAANHAEVPEDVLATRLPHLVEPRGETDRVAWRHDPLHRTTSPMPFFAKLFVEFAKRVTCPVLFVSGGPRGYHPSDEPERIASFANVTTHEIPDAGHMMHWTKPDEVAARLLSFF